MSLSRHELPRILLALSKHGYGKRLIRQMEQVASDKVLKGQHYSYGLEGFYDTFWKHQDPGVPDEVREQFIENGRYKECKNCEHPIFDEVRGQSGRRYCSDECARAAKDEYNEYLRDCDSCGEEYDSEQEGGYCMDRDVCSEDCAWSVLDYWLRDWFRDHPDCDEDATMERLRQTDGPNADAPWFDGEHNFNIAMDECAVYAYACSVCGREGDPESEGVSLDDIELKDSDEPNEVAWFCSEDCAWTGVTEQVRYVTNLSQQKCEQVRDTLRSKKHIEDLKYRNSLDRAIEDVVAAG